EGRHVLQLIAKAIGAARLVERRPRPHAARKSLIQQPAVHQNVHRAGGGIYLNRTKDLVPLLENGAQNQIQVGASVALDQGKRLRPGRRLAEKKDDFVTAVRFESKVS